MAYVTAGPEDPAAGTATILLLHGEPTWGYLYRKMIPVLAGAGHRVIVPDLIGFGRSDKPVERSAYTYEGHVEWMRRFIEATAAQRGPGPLHLFGQDWGGLIGLRLAAENPGTVRPVDPGQHRAAGGRLPRRRLRLLAPVQPGRARSWTAGGWSKTPPPPS